MVQFRSGASAKTNSWGHVLCIYIFILCTIYRDVVKGHTQSVLYSPPRSKIGLYVTSDCFKCGAPEADLYHCLHIQILGEKVRSFSVQHLTDASPCNAIWAIFGYIDIDAHASCKRDLRLLHMIAAGGRKAILQLWNQPQGPTFCLFLDKLTYLMKKDSVETV